MGGGKRRERSFKRNQWDPGSRSRDWSIFCTFPANLCYCFHLDLATLEKAFKAAKKAWKQNKEDKKLKKAKNQVICGNASGTKALHRSQAKKAWEAAKASAEGGEEEEQEEKQEADGDDDVDIESLKQKLKAARKEFKKDKKNKV